jgi:hypothetical protein
MDIRTAQVVDATPTPTPTPTPTCDSSDRNGPCWLDTSEPTTETGGLLPDTSTPIGNQALLGFGALILGALGLATRKILVK